MSFYAAFPDDSSVSVSTSQSMPKKPDGLGTVLLTSTHPNGLTVSACSDGSIIQRFTECSGINIFNRASVDIDQASTLAEDFRIISGQGTVTIVAENRDKLILLANGGTRLIRNGTCAASTCEVQQNLNCNEEVEVTVTVDPETNALVEKYSNGVVVVTHKSGARACYHCDGTQIYTSAGKAHVLIKKIGYADIITSINTEKTAQKHAAGIPVAIQKGGLKVRSTIFIYDGTTIEIGYNTKVTAKVNGRVTVKKPIGVSIVALDSGCIEYYPIGYPQANVQDIIDREDFVLDSVYYFSLKPTEGKLCLVDEEQNHFSITIPVNDDEVKAPSVTVTLSGVISENQVEQNEINALPAVRAIINAPIEPSVFILHGDGTGTELLRPHEVSELNSNPTISLASSIIEHKSSSEHITRQIFLQPLEIVLHGQTNSLLNLRKINGGSLEADFESLMMPVATAFPWISKIHDVQPKFPIPRYSIIRRLEKRVPLTSMQLQELFTAQTEFQSWLQRREATKNQYEIQDPRDATTLADDQRLQKKIIAMYKAAKVRKRKERKQVKADILAVRPCEDGQERMATVQESELLEEDKVQIDGEIGAHGANQVDSDESGPESQQDDSEDEVVDTLRELMEAAFLNFVESLSAKLTITQTRHALVEVLSIGVTKADLERRLSMYGLAEPYQVSFRIFSDIVFDIRDELERGRSENLNAKSLQNQSQFRLSFSTMNTKDNKPCTTLI